MSDPLTRTLSRVELKQAFLEMRCGSYEMSKANEEMIFNSYQDLKAALIKEWEKQVDQNNTYTEKEYTAQKNLAPEFGSWPIDESKVAAINEVKQAFDELLTIISNRIPPTNSRYWAQVRTKLEEACMYAVKGISKP